MPATSSSSGFEEPDEVREMPFGRFELITLGGRTIGRATYQPGWRWSEHVGPGLGLERCPIEHVGLVLSGTATAAFEDGRVVELRAGESFYIPPRPARQLGRRRRAVRLAPPRRRRALRDRRTDGRTVAGVVPPGRHRGKPTGDLPAFRRVDRSERCCPAGPASAASPRAPRPRPAEAAPGSDRIVGRPRPSVVVGQFVRGR